MPDASTPPDDVTPRVLTRLARYTESDPDAIDLDASFEDLALDSLDSLSLVADLEDEFDLTISNDEAYSITSVRQAIDLLRERLAQKAAAGAPSSADAA